MAVLPRFHDSIKNIAKKIHFYRRIFLLENRSTHLEQRVAGLEQFVAAIINDRVIPLEVENRQLREKLNDFVSQDDFRDEYYDDLEKLFRGDQALITARLQPYLPYLINVDKEKPILDLGCGRGEWLDLLKSQGFLTHGVDLNQDFVEQCRTKGHCVAQQDVLKYLLSCEDQSFSVISAFHLIEHLPNRTLIDVIHQALRVLMPGGVLIMETPNPENISVSSTQFYLDPTHKNPCHPQTMHFLVIRSGFGTAEILRFKENRIEDIDFNQVLELDKLSQEMKSFIGLLHDKFYAAPDYAILARKSM